MNNGIRTVGGWNGGRSRPSVSDPLLARLDP